MESGSDYGTGDFCEKDCVHAQGTHREVGGVSAKTTDRVTKNSGKMGTGTSANIMGCQQQYNNCTPQPMWYKLCFLKPTSNMNNCTPQPMWYKLCFLKPTSNMNSRGLTSYFG
jgi:hypothetical protein